PPGLAHPGALPGRDHAGLRRGSRRLLPQPDLLPPLHPREPGAARPLAALPAGAGPGHVLPLLELPRALRLPRPRRTPGPGRPGADRLARQPPSRRGGVGPHHRGDPVRLRVLGNAGRDRRRAARHRPPRGAGRELPARRQPGGLLDGGDRRAGVRRRRPPRRVLVAGAAERQLRVPAPHHRHQPSRRAARGPRRARSGRLLRAGLVPQARGPAPGTPRPQPGGRLPARPRARPARRGPSRGRGRPAGRRPQRGSSVTPLASCRGVDVAYGPVQVLFGVDFDVERGEIVALLGTNGAGKSTLLKALSGLIAPTAGTVTFDGRDITAADAEAVTRAGVSLMPGGKGIFPTVTVDEHLRLAAWTFRKDTDRIEAARAEVLGLFPILAERASQPAGYLSGGEQQMLALAQAFMTKPRLLLVDELSLGLAPTVVGHLLDVLRTVHAAGTTIVIVEQSVNVALTLAERAVFMETGEVRFTGPTAELLERPDLLRSVFIRQGPKPAVATGAADGHRPP